MELRQLQIFCTAARMLNFTKAAVELGYAQSNITSQIRHLEEELNVRLFERIGRGIRLTSEGKRFLINAENILQQCNRAKEEFSPDVFRGILNIGAAETLCVYRLPRLLIEYRQRYPLVEIRVQTENCSQLFELIRTNAVDVALSLTGKIEKPGMVVRTLHNEVMSIVVSPSHPLVRKNIIDPQDLSGHCLILTSEGCGYRPIVLSVLNDYKVNPSAIMELTSVGAIKECTVCGLGVAILPRIAVSDDLTRGRLIELNWNGPRFDVKTQLIYHEDKWISPAVRAFLSLSEHLVD